MHQILTFLKLKTSHQHIILILIFKINPKDYMLVRHFSFLKYKILLHKIYIYYKIKYIYIINEG